jgi:hypothetical protein
MKKLETKSTVLLKHHLKALKLPSFHGECEKLAARSATKTSELFHKDQRPTGAGILFRAAARIGWRPCRPGLPVAALRVGTHRA